MIFEKYLMPDLVLPRFDALTGDMLEKHGIKVLLCDVDNTLATYEQPDPPPDVIKWLGSLKEHGVSVAFISNNGPERLERFGKGLGCRAYSDARKPSPKFIFKALEDIGATPEEAALLGDQLLTDACAAKRAGIPAIIVPPIKDKTSLFFRAKRMIERPYMKKYRAECADKTDF